MTDQHILRSANAIPNPPPLNLDELTIDQIMAERGISRPRAYSVLKDLREEAYTQVPVPTNQRERVLSILLRADGDIHTSQELMVALHNEGYSINGHDSVKVLWSLQKTGHVKFRERQKPRFLYAIRLTDLGREDAERILNGQALREPFLPPADTYAVVQDTYAELPVAVTIDDNEGYGRLGDGADGRTGDPDDALPETSIFHLDDGEFPIIRGIRDRWRKAAKMAQAAKLLEEAGEDDLALNVMNLTSFNSLESEIVELLEKYEEI